MGICDTNVIEQQVKEVIKEKGYYGKKVKNITLKKVSKTSSWRIESVEDVDRYLNDLRLNLVSELDTDTIVNVEF